MTKYDTTIKTILKIYVSYFGTVDFTGFVTIQIYLKTIILSNFLFRNYRCCKIVLRSSGL